MKALNPIDLPSLTTDQTAPAVGQLRLYGRSLAGRCIPEWVGGCGLNTAAQPLLAQNKVAFWNPPGNATTVPGVLGLAAATVVGTATARNVATTNLLTRMKRLGYVSSSAAGNYAAWRVAALQHSLGDGTILGGFTFITRFGVSDAATVSGARMFIGMRNSSAAPTNVEPNTITNCIGVAQLSTSSNMQIVYGGSAAQTAIDLGVNFPAGTLSADAYELVLFAPPGVGNTINYRLLRLNTGHVAEGALTAATPGLQLPLSTTLLCPNFFRTNNATNLAVALDICSVYLETDY